MSASSLKHGIGIFSTYRSVENALNTLKANDFPVNNISIVTKTNDGQEQPFNHDSKSQSTMTQIEGAVAGLVTGGAIGGFIATAAGLGILLIPGVGPALAVESVLAALVRGGIIATVSGLLGASKGWSVSSEQARFSNDRFVQGDYLIVMEATEEEIKIAEPILRHWGIRTWRVYDIP